MDKGYENNRARMAGTIVGEVALDHTLYGEAFYLTHLAVPRLSGVVDVLPLIAPGRLFDELPQEGDTVEVEGQVRSYNKRTAQGSRLMVTLFARSFLPVVPDALAPHNDDEPQKGGEESDGEISNANDNADSAETAPSDTAENSDTPEDLR